MPQYAFVVVSYNSASYLGDCLRSVQELYGAAAEVVVVDNASIDESAAICSRFPQVKLLVNEDNVGFSQACNQGVTASTAPWVVLLNPDAILTAGAIEALVAALAKDSSLAAVGPVSNYAGGWQSIRYWHSEPQLSAHPNNRFAVASTLAGQFAGQVRVSKLVTGFCLVLSRQDYDALGGLDPDLVLGLDDLDFCWRVHQAQRTVGVVPSAFVFHAGHKSFASAPTEQVALMEEKSRRVLSRKLARHYGGWKKIPPSWDLWEVDWFVPVNDLDSPAPSITPSVVPTVSPISQAPASTATRACAYCIWVPSRVDMPLQRATASVQHLRDLGVAPERILLIALGEQGNYGKLGVDVWQLPVASDLQSIQTKIRRWFSSLDVVWMQAGLLVPRYYLDNFGGKFATGPVAHLPSGEKEESSRGQSLGLDDVLESCPLPWFFVPEGVDPRGIPEWGSAFLQAMEWKDAMAQASERMRQGDSLAQGRSVLPPAEVNSGLPLPIVEHMEGCARMGVQGRGQCRDMQGVEAKTTAFDGLVLRLDPLELPGLALYLRELRQKGLRRLALVFDNAAFQAAGDPPWSHRGVLPSHVQRELLQGGFRIDSLLPWPGCAEVAFSPSYGGMDPTRGLPDGEDMLVATHSRLIMLASACAEQYHLEKTVSVVLLAINKLEYTQMCIDSLRKNCRQKLELILVDNGSTDGTGEWFSSIPGAKVVRNAKNLGVAAGWNQGLALATGDYVLILNNDTIVGPNCIENLVRCAENHPRCGMVSPRSNQIAGPQLYAAFQYKSVEEIPQLATEIQNAGELSCWEFPRLKGFCLLIPRALAVEVGPFDEQFGMGNFEDDDYSCRVHYRGRQLLVADDSFLFHFGSVSFQQAGIDWSEQMRRNMQLFDRKWAGGRRVAWQKVNSLYWNPSAPVATAPGNSAPAPKGNADAWELLAQEQWDAAERLFSLQVAENSIDARGHFGLAHCAAHRGRVLDAFAQFCRSLELDSSQEDVAVATRQFLLENFAADSLPEVLEYLHRRHPHLGVFAGVVQENQGTAAAWIEKVQERLDALDWNGALGLLLGLQQGGEDGFEIRNLLGIVKYHQEIYDEAAKFFESALKLNPRDSDALLNYYDCALRLGLGDRAASLMEYALSLDASLSDVRAALQEIHAFAARNTVDAQDIIHFRECNIAAENLIREGMTENAETILREILAEDPENYRALNNLGLLCWYAGASAEAWDYFTGAYRSNPWYVDALVNLYDCAVLSNRAQEFQPLLEQALQLHPYDEELLVMREQLAQGRIPERLQVYFRKQQEDQGLEQQLVMGRRLLDEGKLDSAVILFTDLLDKYPDNVECICGVGIAAFYRKDYEDAWGLFRHSLALKPLDVDALLNLYDVAPHVGKLAEAKALMQNALSVDPSLRVIAQALGDDQ